MADSLLLNNLRFSYGQIASRSYDLNALTEFEAQTLEFCAEWLNGAESFELQTSGSTGEPKTIAISRKQMQASAALTIEALGLGSGDKALVCMDTRFIGGKMMLVRGFEADMELTIVNPSCNPLKDVGEETHFDFTALVPMQLQTMLEKSGSEKDILGRMKAIIVGGGAVSAKLEQELQTLKTPVYSTYGMTETVSHIALRRLNGADKNEYYKVLPGVEIDKDERGCLTIKGSMTKGGTLVTNDLVTLEGKRRFKFEGRVDNVINSGGIKINLEKLEKEAEKVFSSQGLAARRFIFGGLPDERLGEKLVLLIEGAPLAINQERLLLETLRKSLPAYSGPKVVAYSSKFIETATGKIHRKLNLQSLSS